MRSILLFTLVALAACGNPGSQIIVDPDFGVPLAACPAGAEGPHSAKCDYGSDTECGSPFGYVCHCLCDGYWECDQVKLVCDPDGGVPHD